jgi:hypothetical protein
MEHNLTQNFGKTSLTLLIALLSLMLAACGDNTPTPFVSVQTDTVRATEPTSTIVPATQVSQQKTSIPSITESPTSVPPTTIQPTTIPPTTIRPTSIPPTLTPIPPTTIPPTTAIRSENRVIAQNASKLPPQLASGLAEIGAHGLGGNDEAGSNRKHVYISTSIYSNNTLFVHQGFSSDIVATGFPVDSTVTLEATFDDNTKVTRTAKSKYFASEHAGFGSTITLFDPIVLVGNNLNIKVSGSGDTIQQTFKIGRDPFMNRIIGGPGQAQAVIRYTNLTAGLPELVTLFKGTIFYDAWYINPDTFGNLEQQLTLPNSNTSDCYTLFLPARDSMVGLNCYLPFNGAFIHNSYLLNETEATKFFDDNPDYYRHDFIPGSSINFKQAGFKPNEKVLVTITYECNRNGQAQTQTFTANNSGEIIGTITEKSNQYCLSYNYALGVVGLAQGYDSKKVTHLFDASYSSSKITLNSTSFSVFDNPDPDAPIKVNLPTGSLKAGTTYSADISNLWHSVGAVKSDIDVLITVEGSNYSQDQTLSSNAQGMVTLKITPPLLKTTSSYQLKITVLEQISYNGNPIETSIGGRRQEITFDVSS